MLFNAETAKRIRNAEITVSLRTWRRPQARVGGVYYLRPSGAVEVTAMTECTLHDVSTDDLRDAGFVDRSAVVSVLGIDENDPIWVVRFSFHPNRTRPLPDRTSVDHDELVTLATKLARKDERSPDGPWTRATLVLIGKQPGTVSTQLAEQLDRDRLTLKRDIRKLKSLGLTISLDVGYRLSTKGEALVAWLERHEGH